MVGDLPPSTNYQISVFDDSGGAAIQTLTMATDARGVLSFAISAPALGGKRCQNSPGSPRMAVT